LILRMIAVLFLSIAMVQTTAGCDGNGASSDLPLQDNKDESNANDGDQSASTSNNFFVTFDTYPSDEYYVTTSGVFGQDCSISATTNANEDIICIFDILELDAYMRNLGLQYNVPAGMCEYVTALPSYHWDQSPGYGPSAVTVVLTDGQISDTSDPAQCGVTTLAGGDLATACDDAAEVFTPLNESVQCVYDETANGDTYKNCCFGDYELSYVEIDTAGGSTLFTATPDESWGQLSGECMGGGMRGGWSFFNDDDVPMRSIIEVDSNGINTVLPLDANVDTHITAYSYQVNWAEMEGGEHDHTGYLDSTTSTVPYAFEPLDDLDGSFVQSTNHPYLFECWDSAQERIHRIRVYIREWNTLAEWTAYGASSGDASDYDPHLFGVEGTDCDYDAWDGNDTCNDRWDFTDILDAAGSGAGERAYRSSANVDGVSGSYDTSSDDVEERKVWFPYVNY
jgi:hypothetical protein